MPKLSLGLCKYFQWWLSVQEISLLWLKTYIYLYLAEDFFCSCFSTFSTWFACFLSFLLWIRMSLKCVMQKTSRYSCDKLFILLWNISGILYNPNNMIKYSNKLYLILKAVSYSCIFFIWILFNIYIISNFVNCEAFDRFFIVLFINGIEYWFFTMILLKTLIYIKSQSAIWFPDQLH